MIQFNVSNSLVSDWNLPGRHQALFWLTIECVTLYLYIISAMIYLFNTSMKGLRGITTLEGKKDRFKYDAIEYYKLDIDWFAFIFIFFAIDCFTFWVVRFSILEDNTGILSQSGISELNLLQAVILARVFQFIFIGELRD